MLSNKAKNSKGVSLYLAIITLSILLAISLGLISLLVIRFKMVGQLEDSVIALFAADSGMEKALFEIANDFPESPPYSETLDNNATFVVTVKCSPSFNCPLDPGGTDPQCDAPRYCIHSEGIFRETTRALEVKY
jgi:Tfp pilus assembly protein PilX